MRAFALPRFEIPSTGVALDRLWWFLRALLYSVIVYYALSALCQFVGFFYNYSPSMPKGVYAVVDRAPRVYPWVNEPAGGTMK